jgi:hypothetical protein
MFDQYNNGQGGVVVYNKQTDGLWVQNGAIRVATGALIPETGAGLYLGAMSPTGTLMASVSTGTVPPITGAYAFSIFE